MSNKFPMCLTAFSAFVGLVWTTSCAVEKKADDCDGSSGVASSTRIFLQGEGEAQLEAMPLGGFVFYKNFPLDERVQQIPLEGEPKRVKSAFFHFFKGENAEQYHFAAFVYKHEPEEVSNGNFVLSVHLGDGYEKIPVQTKTNMRMDAFIAEAKRSGMADDKIIATVKKFFGHTGNSAMDKLKTDSAQRMEWCLTNIVPEMDCRRLDDYSILYGDVDFSADRLLTAAPSDKVNSGSDAIKKHYLNRVDNLATITSLMRKKTQSSLDSALKDLLDEQIALMFAMRSIDSRLKAMEAEIGDYGQDVVFGDKLKALAKTIEVENLNCENAKLSDVITSTASGLNGGNTSLTARYCIGEIEKSFTFAVTGLSGTEEDEIRAYKAFQSEQLAIFQKYMANQQQLFSQVKANSQNLFVNLNTFDGADVNIPDDMAKASFRSVPFADISEINLAAVELNHSPGAYVGVKFLTIGAPNFKVCAQDGATLSFGNYIPLARLPLQRGACKESGGASINKLPGSTKPTTTVSNPNIQEEAPRTGGQDSTGVVETGEGSERNTACR